jgi:hypothetical protein
LIFISVNSKTLTAMKKSKAEVASLGGQARAVTQRKEAINKYYDNPKYCKMCSCVILVKNSEKVSEVRKKTFCNKTCSASYNNTKRPTKVKPVKGETKVVFDFLLGLTKNELFGKAKNWQSARTCIRKHAAFIYNKYAGTKCCINCGYHKHIEICHITAVSKFLGNSLITDINSIENLIGLCPNCHWEFDNNLLSFKDISRGRLESGPSGGS